MSDDRTVLSARFPNEVAEELEELRPLLNELPEYRARRLTRSELLRIAVMHGLERLRTILADRVDEAEQVDLLEDPQESLDVDED
jgi:hypothetical protein